MVFLDDIKMYVICTYRVVADNEYDQESESSAGARDGDYSWVARLSVFIVV